MGSFEDFTKGIRDKEATDKLRGEELVQQTNQKKKEERARANDFYNSIILPAINEIHKDLREKKFEIKEVNITSPVFTKEFKLMINIPFEMSIRSFNDEMIFKFKSTNKNYSKTPQFIYDMVQHTLTTEKIKEDITNALKEIIA